MPGYYPDSMSILHSLGQMLGIARAKVQGAVAELIAQRKKLPVDVADPFFKGPF